MATHLHNARIRSVDLLRGIVMVLMALDHTRDYFSNYFGDPANLSQTTTGLFITRWITHFCASVFVFLAGSSAYLSLHKKQDKKHASLFLFKRGIWLILLELTVIKFGWTFNFSYSVIVLQVIWAIGISMICLAVLIHLPFKAILGISIVLIAGHNLLDSIQVNPASAWNIPWHIIHQSGTVPLENNSVLFVIYPIIPWIGVMSLGYCFGKVLKYQPAKRDKHLYLIGSISIILFIVLRASNIYGDPAPWQSQKSPTFTILSFINCTKYPPSLLYLLMTLGPAILIMPLLEKMSGWTSRFFTIFGRVPLFYYALHIYLVHAMAIIVALTQNIPAEIFMDNNTVFAPKENWGYGLIGVYLAWAIAILLLYFPSRWFMYVKLNHKKWWLSYL